MRHYAIYYGSVEFFKHYASGEENGAQDTNRRGTSTDKSLPASRSKGWFCDPGKYH
jgi:hypothetical protein